MTRIFASLAAGLVLSAVVITLPAPAIAEQNVKIGDLSKDGYSCKEVGEARHLCTKDKSTTFGCDKLECKPIGRVLGGANPRAPTGGVLRR